MLSIADQLAIPRQHRPRPCRTKAILDALTGDDRKAVKAALEGTDFHSTQIADVLTQAGHQISDQTINRHRQGKCSCGHR